MTVPIDMQNYVQTKNNFSEEELYLDSLKRRDYDAYKQYLLMKDVRDSLKALASYRTLSKGLVTRTVSVSTTPVRLIQASEDRSYTIINPTAAVGLTTVGTLYAAGSQFTLTGNSQSIPLGVANYDSLHLYINVTANTGVFNIIAQTRDPVSLTWVDFQDLVPAGINATGNYYSFFSGLGIVTQYALRWTDNGGGGTLTASISYVLKNGVGGNSSGGAQTIYIGNQYVTRYTGYPLLEGQFRDWFMRENSEVYAVTESGTVNINIIEYI